MDGNWSTIIICAVIAVICIFAVFNYIRKMKSGCCGAGGDSVKCVKPQDRDASHYPYARKVGIEGMHCKNCAQRIENAFNGQAGCMATVNLSGKYAIVRSKTLLEDDAVKQTIWHAGYQATAVEDAK